MDVFKAIKWRRSVRRFSAQKVEREKVLQILEAARLAPSSSNRQAWHFVVVDDPAVITQIPDTVPAGTRRIVNFMKEAPLVIVGCYSKALTHYIAQLAGHENHLVDVSIAMTHMTLAATDLRIGSCWVGWYGESRLRNLLKLPRKYRVVALLVLGYPAERSTEEAIAGIPARPRKTLGEIVSHNKFGENY
ncbi:MAG: nitroreductase family protein [candidate division WOR-3 bacterium]|nr:MAG: nitroreductase family protein [candidate division WOR-3 bacterium]